MKMSENNQSKSDERTFKTRGIIIPVDWDSFGNIVEIAIATKKEQQYLIDREDPRWAELANYIAREIELTGTLRKTDKTKNINVGEYVLLDDKELGTLDKRIAHFWKKMSHTTF
ncbi:hypothetical protein ACFL9U_03705 [Thermodesulfobacteriota bacterium]